jgi:hypothetical protein
VTEERANLAPTGTVMLDIGEDVGALVVHVDSSLLGHEVEARPATGDRRATHADVLERNTPQGPPVYAVVIPGLLAGRYTVWLDGSVPWGDAAVSAGQVTELDRR